MRTIYLDMDDVLADFSTTLLEKTGTDTLSCTYEQIQSSIKEQIDTIFVSLKPIPGSAYLFSLLFDSNYNTKILTSTPPEMHYFYKTVWEQKIKWLEKYVPGFSSRSLMLVEFGTKADYCKKGDILVDDSLNNISKWNNKGGIGIHYNPIVLRIRDQNILAQNTVKLIENLCK